MFLVFVGGVFVFVIDVLLDALLPLCYRLCVVARRNGGFCCCDGCCCCEGSFVVDSLKRRCCISLMETVCVWFRRSLVVVQWLLLVVLWCKTSQLFGLFFDWFRSRLVGFRYALVEVYGYIGHLHRFGHRAFCECNFKEQFSCCMMLTGFLGGFCCFFGRCVFG
ncbi:hypothetical protein MtrunA17_Chr4g0026781 [Medicago truncatula]|uniref:Transmembrane protein n=1 Tax=Medicago truncatula TaxID=3880 RepID=A0A396I4G6_MEDTR|nr:hypothetical protein MtrunA17_Chr4g0026781 [Medicago truncatula]